MRILLDFLPIALFFGAYQGYGIYLATAVLMAATTLQMAITYAMDRRLQTMHKATLALVWVFGTLTLVLHDERFIKWKPTVLYSVFALVLGTALWLMKRNFLKLLLGSQLRLPEAVWHKLGVIWVVYCAFMALTNAYVALQYSTETWVHFKLWGYAFPLLFVIGQGIYIAPHLKVDAKPAPAQAENAPRDGAKDEAGDGSERNAPDAGHTLAQQQGSHKK